MVSKKWTGFGAAIGMIVLILESETVILGASKGIDICIKTVIPSLFPFFVISAILSNCMGGLSGSVLKPFGKLLGMPYGSESIFLLGLCGGYPIGAKSLSDAYRANTIHKNDANRMLCFCSNAGPSFIFGMAASIFQSKAVPWFLWGIQILSAIAVAVILPKKSLCSCQPPQSPPKNPMEQALKAMATVCGWIVFMRVVLGLITSWSFYPMPKAAYILLTGMLEISNGCIELSSYDNPVLCYVLMGQFISFGGLCVILQTNSLIGNLDIKYYISGKLLQTVLSSGLLFITVPVIFPGNTYYLEAAVCFLFFTATAFTINQRTKNNAGKYKVYAV